MVRAPLGSTCPWCFQRRAGGAGDQRGISSILLGNWECSTRNVQELWEPRGFNKLRIKGVNPTWAWGSTIPGSAARCLQTC